MNTTIAVGTKADQSFYDWRDFNNRVSGLAGWEAVPSSHSTSLANRSRRVRCAIPEEGLQGRHETLS